MNEASVGMENFGTVTIIATFLVPWVSLIKRPHWSQQVKYLINLLASLLAAIIGVLVDSDVRSPSDFLALLFTSMAVSQTVYTIYFKGSELDAKLTETEIA